MGWTYQCASRQTWKNGRFTITPRDRKAMCDELYTFDNGKSRYEVIRSALVGTTWYGAVRQTDLATGAIQKIWAGVCLTAVDGKSALNFGYKDMNETCGPCERRCPATILDLLTPTDSSWANEWREDCRKNLAQKKSRPALGKLPLGSVIEFTFNGAPCRAVKRAPCGRFKRAWWKICDANAYIPALRIPPDFRVLP